MILCYNFLQLCGFECPCVNKKSSIGNHRKFHNLLDVDFPIQQNAFETPHIY
jgi:hypothetical protein